MHVRTTTGTSYNDTALAAGTSYSYRVLVMNAARNPSEYSDVASAATGSRTIGPNPLEMPNFTSIDSSFLRTR